MFRGSFDEGFQARFGDSFLHCVIISTFVPFSRESMIRKSVADTIKSGTKALFYPCALLFCFWYYRFYSATGYTAIELVAVSGVNC